MCPVIHAHTNVDFSELSKEAVLPFQAASSSQDITFILTGSGGNFSQLAQQECFPLPVLELVLLSSSKLLRHLLLYLFVCPAIKYTSLNLIKHLPTNKANKTVSVGLTYVTAVLLLVHL